MSAAFLRLILDLISVWNNGKRLFINKTYDLHFAVRKNKTSIDDLDIKLFPMTYSVQSCGNVSNIGTALPNAIRC